MTNVIIYPIKINHETEKAILIHDLLWLPKSQVTVSHHCVVGVASWLYQKNKRYFQYFPEQTIEAVKEYIEYEKEVRQKMQDDPTLCRCSRCGQLFHSETRQSMCINCDIDYSIALGQTAKFGTMSVGEKSDALARGVIYKP